MPTVLDVLVDRYSSDTNELSAAHLAAFSKMMVRLSHRSRQIEAAFEAVRQGNSRLTEAFKRLPSKDVLTKSQSAAEVERSQKEHRERMGERHPDFV